MPHPNLIDLTDQKFGRLTALKQIENKNGRVFWECQCECGNVIPVRSGDLRSGHTKSCGCFRVENNTKQAITHGMYYTPEYKTWIQMLGRCYNSNTKNFKDYGGRGIKVCDKWKHDFMAFYNYIGKRPSSKHSIDRINNNGNYEPSNCKWSLPREQSNNTRHNHYITIREWTMSMAQWARFVGKPVATISARLQADWPITEAMFRPIRPYKRKHL